MAMSAAERKAAQRQRKKESGYTKVEVNLDIAEIEILTRNCALRRPGREPYSADEYIATLIQRDDTALREQIAAMSGRKCTKCGDRLPVAGCCHNGDCECWVTFGWQEVKL
jgi:hypothetical protein